MRFVDDQAMMVRREDDLQALIDRLNTISTEYGMKIETKKTKVFKISKGKETVVIGRKEIEKVKEFCYLWSMIR